MNIINYTNKVDKKEKIGNNIEEKESEKMNKIKKTIRNLILFVLLIVITFYIILKDQNVAEIFGVIGNAKKQYIGIAVICMCIYVTCEAINIRRTLRILGEKTTLWNTIRYALIGFFFSGITPAASGGQPMQIYYMYKEELSVANSTLALLINLSSMQIVTISIALFSMVFQFGNLSVGLRWLFFMGIMLNLSALTLLIIAIFSKKILDKLIEFVIKIMKKLKLKNIEEKEEKLKKELTKYQDSAVYIKQNKKMVLKIILTTYFQFFMYYSVAYWVYRSLGFEQYNILQIVGLQAVLFGTVSGIPSPGAVGVSEGGFIAIFKNVFPETLINSAMLLNRGINFYLLMIISMFSVIISTLRTKELKKE